MSFRHVTALLGCCSLEDGGRQFTLADITITATDGSRRPVDDDYMGLREAGHPGAMSGWSIGIVPNAPAATSGLTFTFREPVNAFGLEVGDWATCCHPSAQYIAFDGGAKAAFVALRRGR